MIAKCLLCNKIKALTHHITEMNFDNEAETFHLCSSCGTQYLGNDLIKFDNKNPSENLKKLIEFVSSLDIEIDKSDYECSCGMTYEEFYKKKRAGCEKCYSFFNEIISDWCDVYHKSKTHVGKRPKPDMNDDVEKMKLLKLQYAKALELEEFEKLPALQQKITRIKSQLLP